MKKITGTFIDEITSDIPSQNWGEEDWIKEFDTMKTAGIDTLIIIRAGFRDMSVFPSEVLKIYDVPDLASFFLDQAYRCGMKLFFGTYDTGTLGYEWKEWQTDWEINKNFIPEIYKKYGSHPSFYGWYVSSETVKGTIGAQEIYSRYTDLMKELAPEKPTLISPGWPSYIYIDDTPEVRHKKFIEEWDAIFSKAKNINICAFQDGSCCYGNDLQHNFELDDYMQETLELCKKHNIKLWANIETFSWKFPIKFPVMDWRYLRRRMKTAEKYAEKLITFEFSHFLSPNSMYPAAQNLYQRYMNDIIKE